VDLLTVLAKVAAGLVVANVVGVAIWAGLIELSIWIQRRKLARGRVQVYARPRLIE
jgi:hypothetical protein